VSIGNDFADDSHSLSVTSELHFAGKRQCSTWVHTLHRLTWHRIILHNVTIIIIIITQRTASLRDSRVDELFLQFNWEHRPVLCHLVINDDLIQS